MPSKCPRPGHPHAERLARASALAYARYKARRAARRARQRGLAGYLNTYGEDDTEPETARQIGVRLVVSLTRWTRVGLVLAAAIILSDEWETIQIILRGASS